MSKPHTYTAHIQFASDDAKDKALSSDLAKDGVCIKLKNTKHLKPGAYTTSYKALVRHIKGNKHNKSGVLPRATLIDGKAIALIAAQSDAVIRRLHGAMRRNNNTTVEHVISRMFHGGENNPLCIKVLTKYRQLVEEKKQKASNKAED